MQAPRLALLIMTVYFIRSLTLFLRLLFLKAINRVHRIGQNKKTYVHRYIVEDTIETKIDKLRIEHEEDQLEDSINEVRTKSAINGGGIDGGFRSQEELLDMLRI
jgi:E3 ubiquitin-protein ligase SHPRH